MSILGLLKKAVIAVVLVLVVSAAIIAGLVATGNLTVKQPTVESVQTRWGTVTDQATTIKTTVVVDNPNPVGVPGVVDVAYKVKMNDVVVASGSKTGIGLSTGESTIDLTAAIPNDRISAWWVSHINRGEKTDLTVTATIRAPGFTKEVNVIDSSLETNLLSALSRDGRTVVSAGGERFLVMANQTASWGTATAESTPLTFTTTITNVHNYGITLDGMAYEVRMNNVTVGKGVTTDGLNVSAGETERVSVTAAIQTEKISEWWASHIRRSEQTNISVSVYGYVVEDGERRRVPLDLVDRELAFNTDVLGSNGTQVRAVETPTERASFSRPSVGTVERRWGTVTDAVTPIRTTIPVTNDNPQRISELVDVTISQEVSINDVLVADGSSTYSVSSGRNALTHVVDMDNSKVPQWWVRHVNNGEQSTVVIDTTATADAEFTRFDIPTETERNTVSTDLLAGIESDRNKEITVRGRTVGVVRSKTASWGEATTRTTPFTVTLTVENTGSVPLTVRGIDYTIDMNDVTVGNGTAPESYTVQPGETRRLTFSFAIDSQQMDDWWVSHIRNGERTVIDFDVVATVAAGTASERVRLTPDDPEDSFETDILNGTAGSALAAAGIPAQG